MNRQPLKMTATEAANKTYRHVASNPENFLKSEAEIRVMCRELLGGMISKGAFVITDAA
ncbi:hypothetical protein [Arthrobacter rhombi]|uniref:hypothetical protein n=1 Tax=Arthrobacter rhombi TaxID=71253 RepID=UPI003FD234E8